MSKKFSYADGINRNNNQWRTVQMIGFAVGISGMIIGIIFIDLILIENHDVDKDIIPFVTLILIITFFSPFSILRKRKNIAPVKLTEAGIEIPYAKISKRLSGEKQLIMFSNIASIREGNIFRDYIIITNEGKKIPFRLPPFSNNNEFQEILMALNNWKKFNSYYSDR